MRGHEVIEEEKMTDEKDKTVANYLKFNGMEGMAFVFEPDGTYCRVSGINPDGTITVLGYRLFRRPHERSFEFREIVNCHVVPKDEIKALDASAGADLEVRVDRVFKTSETRKERGRYLISSRGEILGFYDEERSLFSKNSREVAFVMGYIELNASEAVPRTFTTEPKQGYHMVVASHDKYAKAVRIDERQITNFRTKSESQQGSE